MSDTYDNAYAPSNVYGKTVELLQTHVTRDTGAVHLDVGCGFGAIAPFVKDLGLTYVGVDLDPSGLKILTAKGFETHIVALADDETTYQRLSAVLAGRPLASVTILDTLEHVLSPLDVMRALRRLIAAQNVPLILSVPNVTHRETVAKMVTGRFDYTVDGILDHTHIINFSENTLGRMTRQAGLAELARNDTVFTAPDRDFHLDPEALGQQASYFRLVSELRGMASDTALSYQLVRAYLPGPVAQDDWFVQPNTRPERPFLSIVVRTIGKGTFALRDTLNCLTGQSDQDFEVILLGHRLDTAGKSAVDLVVNALPSFMRDKVHVHLVEDGNRTRPLNVGYGAANGHYIVTLDDDDLVFGHYVETFKSVAAQFPGRLLRARCGGQSARPSKVQGGAPAGISTTVLQAKYPARFSLADHLYDNYTPCMSVAYPREAFHTFRIRFDETLTTAEDYDFMMRCYFLFGIGCSEEITCVYRNWTGRPTSAVVHDRAEWKENRHRILDKLGRMTAILGQSELIELRDRYPHDHEAAMRGSPTPTKPKPTLGQRIAKEWGRFRKRGISRR